MGKPLYNKCEGHVQLHLLSIVPHGGASLFTLEVAIIPPTSLTPKLLYTPISVASSLISAHFYLHSLTFSLRPDEVVSVWRQQKLVLIN